MSHIQIHVCSFNVTTNGLRQANLVLIAYASSEGSGEPAHSRSLARTSAVRSYKEGVERNVQTESQILAPLNGWAYTVKICHDGMLEDTNSLDAPQITVISAEIVIVEAERKIFQAISLC